MVLCGNNKCEREQKRQTEEEGKKENKKSDIKQV